MAHQESQQDDLKIIKAHPTKDLFISMLIRDLTLRDAIGDLVDNSVDGAKSNKQNGSYDGMYIDITASPEEFIIKDNCGGFSVKIAREYAFCFGRKKGYPLNPGSIGHFGIGMKRALFKLGDFFEIKSVAENSEFEMEQRVSVWKEKKDWDFEFKTFEEDYTEPFPLESRYTKIHITDLKEDTKKQFTDTNFLKKLRNEIELEQLFSIHRGLTISLNGTLMKERTLDLISDGIFKPGNWKKDFFEGELSVEVFAGISKDSGQEGGWYIFCNERLIVGPETTHITGWTGLGGDGVAEYHNQFHRFRGYVLFNAENPKQLPWNTTKTGMDMDSPIYKYVRQQMIEMMRPVMTLMNILKKEREGDTPEGERVYNNLVQNPVLVSLVNIIEEKKILPGIFRYRIQPIPEKKVDKGQRIFYYKPKEQIDKVKEFFKVDTNRDVGIKTFDYFYENEIE